jgi:hypothetical protein
MVNSGPSLAQWGEISPELNIACSVGEVFEFQFAPDGVSSDSCLADDCQDVAAVNVAGRFFALVLPVSAAPCGVIPASLWIPGNDGSGNVPCDLINAGRKAVCCCADVSNAGAGHRHRLHRGLRQHGSSLRRQRACSRDPGTTLSASLNGARPMSSAPVLRLTATVGTAGPANRLAKPSAAARAGG